MVGTIQFRLNTVVVALATSYRYSADLWQASSSEPTQIFVGVGIAVILPIILAYLAYAHWIFRGKTSSQTGYGG
jgi:cytochrome bd-type quinol oxidase subunit 2